MKQIDIKKTLVYVLVFHLVVPCRSISFAQPNESLNKLNIERAITKSIIFPKSGCNQDLLLSFSTIALFFSKDGVIEAVDFSNLPKCSKELARVFGDSITVRVNKLKLNKLEFSNKVVIVSLFACTLENRISTDSIYFKNYSGAYRDFDMKKFIGKEVKFFLTSSYYRYPSIK